MNGKDVDGRSLNVNVAKPREERPRRSSRYQIAICVLARRMLEWFAGPVARSLHQTCLESTLTVRDNIAETITGLVKTYMALESEKLGSL